MAKYLHHRKANLSLIELIAIAVGGMVGGGIFSILGIAASLIGFLTPLAIILGGLIAMIAAYAYVKLGVYYKDEGATYAFIKRTFPKDRIFASVIGWFVVFGYISTLSLYAYTFASYAISNTHFADNIWIRKAVAWTILLVFMTINLISVKGMGRIEDLMVYTKMILLFFVSVLLITHGETSFKTFIEQMIRDVENSTALQILIVSSVTFVAYEGFQLVINAVNEMTNPDKNIPRAIYGAIITVIIIYVVLATGALFSIPIQNLIHDKEYALAAGASKVIGKPGEWLVIFSALLATSSAISGTVFGSSHQMASIAEDGYMPRFLAKRNQNNIPYVAIISMTFFASMLILIGGLRLILEFGSVTFLLVSLLVAYTNYKIKNKTNSSTFLAIGAIAGLGIGTILILYFEATHKPEQMIFIISLYIILAIAAFLFGKKLKKSKESM